jgi:hypothetical protein
MKKVLTILTFFIICADTFAQQAVVFKMAYLPGLKYTSTVNTNTMLQMDFKGDSAELKKITANGTLFPVILQNKNDINYTVNTGAFNDKKIFPIAIKYQSVVNKEFVNGNELPANPNNIAGQQITGFCNGDKMQLDTSKERQASDSLKNVVVNSLNNIQAQIYFPDKALKIGDTFAQDIPIALPVNSTPIQINTHLVYKLIAIQNKTALFDIGQTINYKNHTPQGDTEITGTGDGKLFYDVSNSFLKLYQTNLNLTYSMLMGKLTMVGTAKMTAKYQTDIVKN